jgi:TetR/AcrR family transcriptional regulator, cholesterol catabolism regulator
MTVVPVAPQPRRRQVPPAVLAARHARRRAEIVDIAAALFAEHGYAGTGVDKLCQTAGIGRGSLYRYVNSKEELLVEIHERVMGPLLRGGEWLAGQDLDPVLRVRLLSWMLLQSIVDRLDHVRVFVRDYRVLNPEQFDRFRARRKEFERIVVDVFVDGADQGVFVVPDPRVAMLSFLGTHNSTYQWFRPDGPISTEQLSEAYCDLFLAGVLSRKSAARDDDRMALAELTEQCRQVLANDDRSAHA